MKRAWVESGRDRRQFNQHRTSDGEIENRSRNSTDLKPRRTRFASELFASSGLLGAVARQHIAPFRPQSDFFAPESNQQPAEKGGNRLLTRAARNRIRVFAVTYRDRQGAVAETLFPHPSSLDIACKIQ